jgi:predicted metal-dependent HD superfamily phosphohydrolase
MTQPEIEIRRAWRLIAGHDHDGYVDDLLIRYAEPHRHYHTATHVMFVLRHLGDISSASIEEAPAEVTAGVTAEVLAAALYHDAIYDPRVADNEARSAVLAAADLGAIGWSSGRCRSVAELIRATASHVAEEAHDRVDADPNATAMLLDADLAILGAEPGAYQAYVNGVRAEYSHVDDRQWRVGRSAVLTHFVDRQRLFTTEYMHATYEHRARANIEAELAALTHDSARND